ncbi:hypothetical protein ACUIJ5_31080 (plasmid) [Bacillus toyonensis]
MKKFIESLKKEIKEILDCCKQPLWKLRYFFYGWALGGSYRYGLFLQNW